MPRYRSLIGHLEMFLSAVEKKHEKFSRRLAKKKKKKKPGPIDREKDRSRQVSDIGLFSLLVHLIDCYLQPMSHLYHLSKEKGMLCLEALVEKRVTVLASKSKSYIRTQ